MATDIPANITTPDSVQTSIGTLKFFDGLPDKDTVTKDYDNLDLMRGIDVFLNTMSAASLHSNIVGLKSVGRDNQTVVIPEQRAFSSTLSRSATPRPARFRSARVTRRFTFIPASRRGSLRSSVEALNSSRTMSGCSTPAPHLFLLSRDRNHARHVCENGRRGLAVRGGHARRRRQLYGGKNYKLHLPPNIPVKTFWSLIPYDTQTRSVLQTDQRDTALTSESGTVKSNSDGSVDVYFGSTAPLGKESNWIQTEPNKGWFTLLRLYGALDPWFDKTWRPGEITLVK